MKKAKPTKKGRGDRWFTDHPVTSLTLFWVVNLMLLELLLRGLNPGILQFTHQARQVHGYSRPWKMDLKPNQVAHMRLVAPDGQLLYNFLLTTGPDGFRTYDRGIDRTWTPVAASADATGTKTRHMIHAVGDSFTMGWGVDYASSYPAQLDWLLPVDYSVLNLGMDGFGTVAATEKSMALWDRFPADHVIYLFSPNDMEDDEKIQAYRQRGALYHFLYEFYDILRRDTYTANLPTAIKWFAYFGEMRNRTDVVTEKTQSIETARSSDILFEVDALDVEIPDVMHPSLRQILRYSEFLRARGSALTVYVYSAEPQSLVFYRFCVDHGIEAHLFDVGDDMKLLRDGHLNYAGNYAFARLVRDRVLADR